MRARFTAMFGNLLRLTNRILRALAYALEVDEDFFVTKHSFGVGGNMSKVRSLFYPPILGKSISLL